MLPAISLQLFAVITQLPISREEIETAVVHRLTGVPNLRAEIELSYGPNPASDPKQAQTPLDMTVVWEWSAEGYEWFEVRDRFLDGRPEVTKFAHSRRPQECWNLDYDASGKDIVRASLQRGNVAIPGRDFAILPTLLGTVVPGMAGELIDFWKQSRQPMLIREGSIWRAELGENHQFSFPIDIQLQFDSEHRFALSSLRLLEPTMLVTRRDGKQEPFTWHVAVDEWRELPLRMTNDRFWLPSRATLTTSGGISSMRIRSAEMGFPTSEIRPCPELPFKTQVHEIPTRAGEQGRDYVVGGAKALAALMDEQANAARLELAKRERTGHRFDARPRTGWQWPRWVLVGSLLVGTLSVVWWWKRGR